MRRRSISAHELAIEICRREKLCYFSVKRLAEKLLKRYSEGQNPAIKGVGLSPEAIRKEKQSIRRRYIEIIMGIKPFTEEEIRDFIWDVVSSGWFESKAQMVLDEIEKLVDGQIAGREYLPTEDYLNQGIQIRYILSNAFLKGRNSIKEDKTIWTEMEISRATMKRRKADGIVLFGMVMWIYAKKREMEDVENGIVEALDYDLRDRLEKGRLVLAQ